MCPRSSEVYHECPVLPDLARLIEASNLLRERIELPLRDLYCPVAGVLIRLDQLCHGVLFAQLVFCAFGLLVDLVDVVEEAYGALVAADDEGTGVEAVA